MVDVQTTAMAAHLLYSEARCLDLQDWDGWLAHYAEDVEYWVPAWKSESELVSDVQREVSLIYHRRRDELYERVLRIRSRKSVTAMPLPRTCHLVSNVIVDEASAERMVGSAAWTVHEYDPRTAKAHTHFGRYEFTLVSGEGGWKIARKKTVLLNDRIPTVIDFYNL
jgi:3-phenylpropionate/cinnamic acid dioxygenase small subunit